MGDSRVFLSNKRIYVHILIVEFARNFCNIGNMEKVLKHPERKQLEAAYDCASDKRTANKINSLLLLDDGYSPTEIAEILRVDSSTIYRQKNTFIANGLEAYLENPFLGGTCKLERSQLEKLESHLDSHLCETTEEIVKYVEESFGITYTNAGMAALLNRLGFVFKKPTIVPGKADPELQEAFIDYYNRLRNSMSGDDKLYFLDGVHPQHNSQAGYGWIRKGAEKELKSNTGRQRVNLNGALDVDTHEVIIRADDTLNATSTIKLFQMIENQNPDANKIVLIIDNAPYYFNGDVVEYANNSTKLELVFLPAYSPNLNLIERVWRFMKEKVIYNTYHEKFTDFKASIGNFFQTLPMFHSELENILTEEFQVFV